MINLTLSIILTLLSYFTYSQVTFIYGKATEDNKFSQSDSITVQQTHIWIYNKSERELMCGIYPYGSNEVLTVKFWYVDEYIIDSETLFFFLKDELGRGLVITFFYKTHNIYGYYPDTTECYFIYGDEVYFPKM